MFKRIALVALALLLATATVAVAAGTMAVTINGKAVTFKTAPRMENNMLMVPLAELVEALGVEAKWNLNTNTLEVTDARAKRIAELEARVKELEAQVKTGAGPTSQQPAVKVTKENLVSQLQEKFGVYKVGAKQMRVSWSQSGSEPDPLFVAQIFEEDEMTFFDLNEPPMVTWFNDAAKLIAQVHKKASATLLMRDTYSFYPSADHDSVRLTSDGKWAITDYEIWSFIKDGVPQTDWDD